LLLLLLLLLFSELEAGGGITVLEVIAGLEGFEIGVVGVALVVVVVVVVVVEKSSKKKIV